MVYINEWLPNPVGKDAEGEWVELWNDSDSPVSLVGWKLQSKDGKSVFLGGSIGPQEYIGFRRQSIKVTLHNIDGELTLYNPSGRADRQSFFGEAPEGKSFARTEAGTYLFTEPTFGYENKFEVQENLVGNIYSSGVLVEGELGGLGFFGLVLGVAVVLTGLALFVVKRNENLSNLLFRRDEESWS
ncbi:MAG: lamin tail domain-containing protein [bacterium]|nr:lamin tail domain-containing protein [bacterium]